MQRLLAVATRTGMTGENFIFDTARLTMDHALQTARCYSQFETFAALEKAAETLFAKPVGVYTNAAVSWASVDNIPLVSDTWEPVAA